MLDGDQLSPKEQQAWERCNKLAARLRKAGGETDTYSGLRLCELFEAHPSLETSADTSRRFRRILGDNVEFYTNLEDLLIFALHQRGHCLPD